MLNKTISTLLGAAVVLLTSCGARELERMDRLVDGRSITYELSEAGNVSLAVYDPRDGAMLRILLAGERQAAGEHTVDWDGLDWRGEAMLPGDYQWRLLSTPGFKAEYRLSIGTNSPDASWAPWLGNHGSVRGIAADETGVYLGSGGAETVPSHVKLSHDHRERLWQQYYHFSSSSARLFAYEGRLLNMTGSKLQVMDAANGVIDTSKEVDLIWWEPGKEDVENQMSVGANARTVVVGHREGNELRWFDIDTGEVTATVEIATPEALGVAVDGRVYVVSAGKLVLLSADGDEWRTLSEGLVNARLVEIDRWTDEVLVVEGEPSHQIKRFSRSGELLKVYGKYGGRPEEGPYDQPTSFLGVQDIAALPEGGFAVSETRLAPRRTALFNRAGELVTEWYGGNPYFSSVEPDPRDHRDVWMDSHYGWLMRARVDYEKGTWRPVATYRYCLHARRNTPTTDNPALEARHDAGLQPSMGLNAFHAWRPLYHEGTRYLVRENPLNILRHDEEQDRLIPVVIAVLGVHQDVDKRPAILNDLLDENRQPLHEEPRLNQRGRPIPVNSFVWIDGNGDGIPQSGEIRLSYWGDQIPEWSVQDDFSVLVTARDGTLQRLPVERWNEAKTPVYPPLHEMEPVASLEKAVDVDRIRFGRLFRGREGGLYGVQVGLSDRHGDIWPAHNTGDARLLKYAKDGSIEWITGTKMVGRSREDTLRSPPPPNRLSDPLRIIGTVGDTVVLAERSTTPAAVYTFDGLFAGRFLDHRADDGLPAQVYRWNIDPDTQIRGIINGDMARGGSLTTTDDGDVYWYAAGRNNSPVYRVTGWDNWTRLGGTVALREKVSTAQAAGSGLTARYFANRELAGKPVLERVDEQVWFKWGGKPERLQKPPDSLPPSLEPTNFSVEWTGQLEPKLSEPFVFSTYTRGGVRLWVDGELVIDDWIDYAGEQPYGYTRRECYRRTSSQPVPLTAGRKIPIRMQYYMSAELDGDPIRNIPQAHLNWESPTLSRQHIPTGHLYPEAENRP